MLSQPPPGYNTQAVNSQTNQILSSPGPQGAVAQGYFNPYQSNFSTPSSYAVPSSVDVPQPWYGQQPSNPNTNAMLQALRGK